ncbi:MAG: methylated-DNA--[protein]-cysteine S-methyltransferase [Methanospirillum sp.]|nr:methylated-DNA--[protein]-cysteine S-methyltransferase [Methanospirillum sp.]
MCLYQGVIRTTKHVFFYQTEIGKIGISENGEAITHLYFEHETIPDDALVKETPLLKEAAGQLQSYLSGKRKEFTIPLAPSGTEFMQQVWKYLLSIPYGETRTYQEAADSLNKPNGFRAIGLANHRNPIPIFIPCHRVIAADGTLAGYRGGVPVKAMLLQIEQEGSS